MTLLVSILIPVHNGEAYLAEAVRSLLGQSWPCVEIVVVDDGSTDRSLAVARSFEGPRVKVVSQPNSGAPAARNRAFAEAQGDYVQFLDADDLLAPDKIEVQMRRLLEEPGAIAACPWGRFYDRPDSARFIRTDYWRDMDPVDWLVRCWEQGGMMHPGVWLAAREVFVRAGPWDETLRRDQDGEYFCRALLASRRVLFCEGTASLYRSGLPGSISAFRTAAALESYFRAAESRAKNLLSAEDGARTRRACSRRFEDFVYDIYPSHPELCARAWRWVERLGGPYFRPEGGPLLRLATGVLGWRSAVRLRRLGRPLMQWIRHRSGGLQ